MLKKVGTKTPENVLSSKVLEDLFCFNFCTKIIIKIINFFHFTMIVILEQLFILNKHSSVLVAESYKIYNIINSY